MYYVQFNSITLATRMKNHFRYSGRRVKMVHTPTELTKGGCSYSLIIEPHLLNEVLTAANDYGITVKGVYEQTESGFCEVNIL